MTSFSVIKKNAKCHFLSYAGIVTTFISLL